MYQLSFYHHYKKIVITPCMVSALVSIVIGHHLMFIMVFVVIVFVIVIATIVIVIAIIVIVISQVNSPSTQPHYHHFSVPLI